MSRYCERVKQTTIRACLAALLLAAAASAQGQDDSGSIEGGLGFAWQDGPSGTHATTYVTAPGGRTLGWVVGASARVAPRLSVAAELSSTGMMRATEPSRYFTTYEEERRDRVLSLVLRPSIPLRRWLAIEPSAGVAVTFAGAWSRAVRTDPLALVAPDPRIQHRLDRGVGLALGVDARLGSGRLALVPAWRLLGTGIDSGRYDDTSSDAVDIASIYPGGYPSRTLRMDVKVRWRF
ncbi:MAG: hypothetical protein QM736_10680 [Vicinamibacterales bacterium]